MSSLKLWPEQVDAYKLGISQTAVALFFEQRTGKTYITLAILRKLAGDPINLETGKGNDFCGLLMCLLANKESTWADKLTEFLPWLSVYSDWEEFKKAPSPKIFLVHLEGVKKHIKQLVKYKKFNWACLDEAHRISKRGTKQARDIARLSWIRRRLILTGTPIEKQPVDLWSQFRFLAPEVFGKNWADFEREWLDFTKIDMSGIRPGTMAWQQKVLQQRILRNKAEFRWDRLEEYIDLVKPYAVRVTKQDMGIKEPKVTPVNVKLPPRQMTLYKLMAGHSVVNLSSGTRVMAELRVTQIIKERQLASGFIYDEDGDVHMIGDQKMKEILKRLETAELPVVIFSSFRPPLERFHQALTTKGYVVGMVHGGVKKATRPEIWRRFQRGGYDVLLVQNRTGGIGVDLWRANTAFVHSLGHSFVDWDQLKSRLDHKSKDRPAEIFVFCGENTIDWDVFDLVCIKCLNGQKVLSQLKRRKSQNGPQVEDRSQAGNRSRDHRLGAQVHRQGSGRSRRPGRRLGPRRSA